MQGKRFDDVLHHFVVGVSSPFVPLSNPNGDSGHFLS